MNKKIDPVHDRDKRRYPPFWERAVPVFIALIALLILGLLVVAILVVLGIFP